MSYARLHIYIKKVFKVIHYLPKMRFSTRTSMYEISQIDQTLIRDTWLTPDLVIWDIFEARLFRHRLAMLLGVVW